jgi:hypothetical protein
VGQGDAEGRGGLHVHHEVEGHRLLDDVTDVGLELARGPSIEAPDVFDQAAVRDNAPRVHRREEEQAELQRRELHGPPRLGDLLCIQLEDQVATDHLAGRLVVPMGVAPPEDGLHLG